MLIGVTGNSGSKKTGVTKYLRNAYGFARIHAGMPIKKAAAEGFGLPQAMVAGKAKDMETAILGGARPRDLMEAMSEAVARKAPMAISASMRRRIGKHAAAGRSVVVDGIRSPQQAQTIKELGGYVVRVDRGTSIDPKKPTDASAAMVKVDYTISTAGSKKDRKAACDKMLDDLRGM